MSISTNQTGPFGTPVGKALVLADALLHLTSKHPDWKNYRSLCSSPVWILMVDYFFPMVKGGNGLGYPLCSSKCSTGSSRYAKDGRTAWSGG